MLHTLFNVRNLMITLGALMLACKSESQSVHHMVGKADVEEVTFSGVEFEYQFSVTLRSPDTGCDQFADWWEVVSESGELLYRRILGHSHVSEQPFTRAGGEIGISENQQVWVRGHMSNSGYGGKTMFGSVEGGFKHLVMPAGFAADLEMAHPLPSGCAF